MYVCDVACGGLGSNESFPGVLSGCAGAQVIQATAAAFRSGSVNQPVHATVACYFCKFFPTQLGVLLRSCSLACACV